MDESPVANEAIRELGIVEVKRLPFGIVAIVRMVRGSGRFRTVFGFRAHDAQGQ